MKYPEKESARLEFKQQLPSHQQIVKTIIAFCNHFGGKIIIGIDDKQNICGIDEDSVNDVIESLEQSIYQSTTPAILPSLYTQRLQGKLLLIIEVSSGMNKPYFITSLGLNEGVFIRVGSHTMKATSTIIQSLLWTGKGLAMDEIPIYSASPHDIDTVKIMDFLKEHRPHYKPQKINETLLHYKLTIEEHQRTYPTLAGILLFTQNPQKYFPETFIICSHFQGTSGRKAIASKDCIGDLLTQVHESIEFTVSQLNHQFEIKKTRRTQILEIPEIALREIIINAIVHRDYQIPGPIKIAIYDDRIEIFSPGNFPGPLKVNQLEMGITYIRNHVICKIFREAGYIEKLGSGFLTLFESYRKAGLPEPIVIEGAGFIKCILPRAGKQLASVSLDTDNEIMSLLHKYTEITTQDLIKELSISRQTAARRLSHLIKIGKLTRIGKGPSVKYYKDISYRS